MNRRTALFAAMLLACPAGLLAAEQPSSVSSADAHAIQDVISRQIAAFSHDDATGAYRFAAANIKQSFPTAERFMAMVRHAYPSVYHPRSVEFTDLSARDNAVVQHVELVGPDRKPVLALYTMVRDGHGGWSIAGCALAPSSRVTAGRPVPDRMAARRPRFAT